jgi:hypothetical protein
MAVKYTGKRSKNCFIPAQSAIKVMVYLPKAHPILSFTQRYQSSFFGSLKQERVQSHHYRTRYEAEMAKKRKVA